MDSRTHLSKGWTCGLFLAAAMTLAACNLPEPGPTPTPVTPTCPTESLVAPDLVAPDMYELVGTVTPTLSWSYPDACQPEGYRIDLSPLEDFSDTSLSGGTGNPSTSWAPGSPLQPATQYWWRVAAINGTTLGPYSEVRSFFAGGACDGAHQSNPVLLSPADGATVNTSRPLLEWSYPYNPGCLPHRYNIELSTDISFSDTSLNGETTNPNPEWTPTSDLNDCTTYYWRVAPVVETTIGDAVGPLSSVWSFDVDLGGACEISGGPTPVPPPTLVPTPTAVLPPMVKALMNANCRLGPSTGAGQYGFLLEGQTAEATGWNEDAAAPWFVITVADKPKPCWISGATLEYAFDPSILPFVPPPPGSIAGLVWHDICEHKGGEGGEPLVLGKGCAEGLGPNEMRANGVYDSFESGFAGVTLHLGAGACPSTGLATAVTDANGQYSFTGLSAGTYCVSFNPLTDGNDSVLIPGGLTYPTVGGTPQTTVNLLASENKTGVSFGWMWQFGN